MKQTYLIPLLFMLNSIVIFDFSQKNNLNDWSIVDDVVMGGQSNGNLILNKDNNAVFYGEISLQNNGGFSSIRHQFDAIHPKNNSCFVIKLKGDQKKYQFRVKTNSRDYYSYAYTFETSGEWEEIRIPFTKMVPVFRGRTLDMNAYTGNQVSEISILISNKKAETFKVTLAEILIE